MRNILTRRPKPPAPAPQPRPGPAFSSVTPSPATPSPATPSPATPSPATPSSATPSSANLPEIFPPGRKVKKDEIRALAELIRKRYGLDVEIWNDRDAPDRDRELIRDKMRRADAMLVKIRSTIQSWNRPDIFDSPDDWKKFEDIKMRLMSGEKRVWAKDPPWLDKGK